MDHIRLTLKTLVDRVEQQERELLDTKTAVNSLLKILNEPPRYSLESAPTGVSTSYGSWRSDEFYGQPLSTVVKKILLARRDAGLGAASVLEIYQDMLNGGFNFGSTDEENAKSTLRSSLRKNSATFHRLPSGQYGLKEWYPIVRERAKSEGATAVKDVEGADDEFDFEQKEKELEDVEASDNLEKVAAVNKESLK